MALTLVTAPASEPLTIAEAKAHLHLGATATGHDDELLAWITAARQHVEDLTHRALITQTWDLKLDDWTCDRSYYDADSDGIRLPKPPTISVTSVSYVDSAGVSRTWTAGATGYLTDLPTGPTATRGRIYPAYGISYPTLRGQPNAVTVRFVAGYGATPTSVPAPIRAALLLLIGHWFLRRESVSAETLADIPDGVAALLWPFKGF